MMQRETSVAGRMAEVSRPGLVAVLLLTMVACAPEQPPPHSPAATVTSSPQPSPMPTPSPTLPPCDELHFAEPSDHEQVQGWKLQPPSDRGPEAGATGTVHVGDDGIPLSYLVAADDFGEAIAHRMCMDLAYLNAINDVRRDGAGGVLFVGDTINLDAHCILVVGSQGGQVLSNSPPTPIPPQRTLDQCR